MAKLIKFAEIRGRIGWKGYTVKDLRKEGPLVVGAGDINELNHLILDNAKHLSIEKYEESPEIFLKKNDLLVVKVGPIGKLAIIDEEIGEASINPNCVIVRPTKIDPNYLFYFLCSPYGQKQLLNNSAASVQSALNQKELANMDVVTTDEANQIKIGNLLHNLDKKIKNNKNISKKIDLLIKTIYDYWFLQFEFPIKNGSPYKSSGGKTVFNKELNRLIPKGWEVKNLFNWDLISPIDVGVTRFNTKVYLPTSNIENNLFIEGQAVSFDNRENRANMQPAPLSVWFAKMKGSIKHLSIPQNSEWFTKKYILSTGMQGLQCNTESFAYIHSIINSGWFETYKDALSHGSTQQGINDYDLKNLNILIPNQDVLIKFSQICTPLIEKMFSIITENNYLTSLRNFLLPLLINGQAKIK